MNKIAEKCISELMIADMKHNLDPTQYANQKCISMQHYLINILNRILTSLDHSCKGEAKAVIATLIDWKQAWEKYMMLTLKTSNMWIILNFGIQYKRKISFDIFYYTLTSLTLHKIFYDSSPIFKFFIFPYSSFCKKNI